MDHARGGLTQPDFAELFSALPVAALLVDPRGHVVSANAASESLLNVSERAMQGQQIDLFVRFDANFAERRGGRTFAAYDVDVGVGRIGRMRVDLIEAEVPDHVGWTLLTLRQSRARTPSGERSPGARAAVGAAAMLAHEIKNPLSGIRGAAQLIGEGGPGGGDVQEELTRLITSEVDRIAALIDRMQDFTDTRPLNLAAANVYPLLDHVRQVALAGFARAVTIEERFDPSLPPALVDADAFTQVMLNFIKNACEALADHEAPRIVLATAYRHGMAASAAPGRPRMPLPIEISVIDNGPGAPPEIADHLFEPFVSGKSEGRGLGLPLVEKLVADMGGIVSYTREGEPEMTVFRMLLPRAQ